MSPFHPVGGTPAREPGRNDRSRTDDPGHQGRSGGTANSGDGRASAEAFTPFIRSRATIVTTSGEVGVTALGIQSLRRADDPRALASAGRPMLPEADMSDAGIVAWYRNASHSLGPLQSQSALAHD